MRRAVGSRLRLWGREELIGAAGMCVTELLSNVHKHAGSSECVLTLENRSFGIHAAVSDSERALPVVREPDYLSESGRGMFLLSKTAHEWGTDLTPRERRSGSPCAPRRSAADRMAGAGPRRCVPPTRAVLL
ncbi:ATP-binding protein [Streptomyces sp. M19]